MTTSEKAVKKSCEYAQSFLYEKDIARLISNRKIFVKKPYVRTFIVHWQHFENNNPFGAEMILYAWLKSIHGTGWYSEFNLEALIEISDFYTLIRQ